MPKNRVKKHVLLGVVGDSAAGKSTISRGIAQILGPDRCTIVCTDDYHCYDRRERAANGISALDLRGNYVDIMEQHFQLLRDGKPILKPIYDHSDGSLVRPEYVEPKEYIILEGLLGFSTRAMRECFDVKLYLDPSETQRVKWKIHRDTTKRGYTEEQVRASLEKRVSDSAEFIRPQRTFADIVVSFTEPETGDVDASHLDVLHSLRPTLPHPDFSKIAEFCYQGGFDFGLKRDIDGKPIDRLHIRGDIGELCASKIEDHLWQLIPEASHLRDRLGLYNGVDGRQHLSHPLALTQLLIAFHMVKAAGGTQAV